MAKAKITMIGFHNYMIDHNDDLFKNLSVPTGINKDDLINNILMKGGEFEVLYSNPTFMQNMIGVWSNKWQHTMERWVNALSIDYEPLENYDRNEEWTDNSNRITSNSATNSQTRQENAIGNDYSNSTGNGTNTNTVSAYDAGTYQPHDQGTSDTSGTNLSSSLTSTEGNTSNTHLGSDVNNGMDIHKGRTHGNLGVTTSQQMLQSELDLYRWNLYDEIADLFISEFCIYIY